VTQIQDQSIGQSARILAVLATIVLAGAWLATGVLRFAERALQTLGYLG
jgi:type III secretion protein S